MTRACVGYASLNHVSHVRQPILVLCSCQTHRPIKHVPAILLCSLTAKQVHSITSSRICSNIDGLLMCAFQKEPTFLPFLWRQCHTQEGGIFCLHPQTSLSTFHSMDQSLLLQDFEAVAMYQVRGAIWQRQTWSQAKAKQWLRSYIHIKLASWPSHYNKWLGAEEKRKKIDLF